VIGGGISGLACARGILDRAPHAEVTVLEAGAQPGGPLRSEHAEGFVCEAGPHGFLNADPRTIALAGRLGLSDRLLPADERNRGRYIFHGGRLHPFPNGALRFLTSDLLSLWGRARVLVEPLLPAAPGRGATDDESVGAFARRRLGNEVAERLVDPLVCGIYGGDMDRLSLAASAPQLAAMIRPWRRAPGRPAGPGAHGRQPVRQRQLVSFVGGTGELVRALAASLGGAIECGSPVAGLAPTDGGFRVAVGGARPRELAADAVIVAVPAPAARSLVGALDGELESALAAITYLPAVVVALGFRERDVGHALDGFGYLVPRAEGGNVLGVLWSSSMFPGHRSPEGSVLVQAILGGSRQPDIADYENAQLEEEVCAQLRLAIGVVGAPTFRRTYRHRPGLPQYEVGHHQHVARIEAAESRVPGLFLTGNALRGVGMNACTADAEKVAKRVLVSLGISEPAAAMVDR
jgi:oxygen-dependent protoporphyrinogen oxidase